MDGNGRDSGWTWVFNKRNKPRKLAQTSTNMDHRFYRPTNTTPPNLHQTRTPKQDHNTTTITYYFTNFPANQDNKTMLEVFKRYGQATNVYIAGKRNKMGKHFGFCRFDGILDPIVFEKTLNTICIGTQRILCNIARHQRKSDMPTRHKFNSPYSW